MLTVQLFFCAYELGNIRVKLCEEIFLIILYRVVCIQSILWTSEKKLLKRVTLTLQSRA
jgi:hypothetical protein